MKQFTTHILISIFLLFQPIETSSVFAQTIDSTYITDFFTKRISQSGNVQAIDSIKRLESKLTKTKQKDLFYLNYGRYLMLIGKFKESDSLGKKGIDLYKTDELDYELIKFYNLRASNAAYTRDYANSIKLFNLGIKVAEHHNDKKQSAYLNSNIANIFFSIQDYDGAYEYSKRAKKLIDHFPEDSKRSFIYAILSVAEAKVGKNEAAKRDATISFQLAEKTNDFVSMIVANYAFGDIALAEENYTVAHTKFSSSLQLSNQLKHFHFALLNNIGLMNASIGLNKYTEAINFGKESLALANMLSNTNTLYSIHRKLAICYGEVGNYKEAYEHQTNAFSIYQETTNSETKKSINDILIKYDTEKKEKEIARQELELEKDKVEQSQFRQIILALGIILLILSFTFILYRNRSKQKALIIQAKYRRNVFHALIRGEEEERNRVSHELHDGLASSLTALRFRLESIKLGLLEDKESILSQLRSMHEETRRIAHNLSPLNIEKLGLEKSLEQFCIENSNSNTIIKSQFSSSIEISNELTVIIYRTIQELVQNALKHASARQIDINITINSDETTVIVEDNGSGFDSTSIRQTGGLSNLRERIKNLQGEIEIDSEKEAGTVIFIQLPNQKI